MPPSPLAPPPKKPSAWSQTSKSLRQLFYVVLGLLALCALGVFIPAFQAVWTFAALASMLLAIGAVIDVFASLLRGKGDAALGALLILVLTVFLTFGTCALTLSNQ